MIRTALLSLCASVVLLPAALAENTETNAPPPRPTPELPEEFQGVDIDEQLDQQLPLDAVFKDANGREVRLGDYFNRGKPIILTLNYYRCPQLCGLQLNGMTHVLGDITLAPGEDFEIITISFDPLETPSLAKLKQQNYLEYYGDPRARGNWHFLTGSAKSINAVLDATGFGVRYDERTREWVHNAALIVCTPDGRISRYLYGIEPEAKTLRLTLVEAGQGKIGTPLDKVLLYCFQYDPDSGSYTMVVVRIMQLVGGATFLCVATLLLVLWRREMRQRQSTAAAQA